ncbi:bifunctional 5,10-methylenetetrahydrofolate dehydrogenase/5,10-methenyltetrahydrofolate cyclohydrolase [Patescibacteria group bacterium]|nr:bifunctional 5,10-methylenetetrahydrofolate dehydrogenase/5,10-methenyltetrahydrofolate cyclohydrolase [Patescibacteria group bacterium]
MKKIDGNKIAAAIRQQLKSKVSNLPNKPGLAIILVGDNSASHTYVQLKESAADEIGINFKKYLFPSTASQADITDKINQLNNDSSINGILVQLPLPKGFNEDAVIASIKPVKDVDGFHPDNIKALISGRSGIIPGLAAGIVELIVSTKETLSGKTAMIFANNPIFSDPLEYLLDRRGVKAVTCHADAEDCWHLTKEADIVVVAVGRPKFINGDMIKKGAIVIDVGFNHVDGRVIGDVDVESVQDKASWLTPVPGGVGPMTVAMLLSNVIKAYELQSQ